MLSKKNYKFNELYVWYVSVFDCFNFYERWAICMIKNIQPSMTGEKGTVLGITEVKPTLQWVDLDINIARDQSFTWIYSLLTKECSLINSHLCINHICTLILPGTVWLEHWWHFNHQPFLFSFFINHKRWQIFIIHFLLYKVKKKICDDNKFLSDGFSVLQYSYMVNG